MTHVVDCLGSDIFFKVRLYILLYHDSPSSMMSISLWSIVCVTSHWSYDIYLHMLRTHYTHTLSHSSTHTFKTHALKNATGFEIRQNPRRWFKIVQLSIEFESDRMKWFFSAQSMQIVFDFLFHSNGPVFSRTNDGRTGAEKSIVSTNYSYVNTFSIPTITICEFVSIISIIQKTTSISPVGK